MEKEPECMDTGPANNSKTDYPPGLEQAALGGHAFSLPDSNSLPALEATNTVPVAGQAQGECQQRRKRSREVCGGEERVVEKRGCEEGMSWWTCMMLDMNHEEYTRAQVAVRKVHSINHN